MEKRLNVILKTSPEAGTLLFPLEEKDQIAFRHFCGGAYAVGMMGLWGMLIPVAAVHDYSIWVQSPAGVFYAVEDYFEKGTLDVGPNHQ